MLPRRAFLKLGLLSLASLANLPWKPPLPEEPLEMVGLGRVAAKLIYLYADPSLRAERLAKLQRDSLLPILEEFTSPEGPAFNPLWYRVEGGYVHSGHVQRVDGRHHNQPLGFLSEKRLLGRVTVPYTQSFRVNKYEVWKPLYRLYYDSIHWITAIEQDPEGVAWYRLTDERLLIHYYVPAAHVKPLFPADYAPIQAETPPEDKRIEVSLSQQRLRAFEGDRQVMEVSISSGLPQKGQSQSANDIPTETPLGSFRVATKFPARHMGNGYITADLDAYELPGVPWNMFFHHSGYALHGTYWHNNFGTPMSHGCINLRPEHAFWLFRWSDPPYQPGKWYTAGRGTLVRVVE